MKKRLFAILMLTAVLVASVFSVGAIDFSAEEKYESVFVIRSGNALGSGFAIGPNCIITNAHVINNPRRVQIETVGGDRYTAYVAGIDEDQDIAVLVIPDGQFPVFELADPDAVKIGDDVYTIGAPKSMAYTLTKGVISAKNREVGRYSYLQTDAPINEGNSGGPLLNAQGQVLGMNTLKLNDSEGIGLAIPITSICQYLTDLDITMDENGNVADILEAPEEFSTVPSETVPEEKENQRIIYKTEHSAVTVVAVIVAVCSIVLNIVLLALLLEKKKRTVFQKPDPTTRTDFEIDILEE